MPTSAGPLVVKWARDAAGQFRLQATAPAGTGGQIWISLASASATSTPVTSGATFVGRNGLYDVYSVGAGLAEFTSAP
ncbi:hypothetical protein [Paractinoplanes rishiriensis]|uniref:Uncharacterized protein n=1 Tax=Paractinoplanes rishiriensis TaxID=1050105 RepID=A0A919KD26_9ACTN|nr:hypothetical protein [Actinoplanes rishiriensis]GIF01727.1 hypothetical protein Ari01nite_91910 [Actinoplanes rishiriensis]